MKTCYVCGKEHEDKDIMLEGVAWVDNSTIYACKECVMLYGYMQFNVPPDKVMDGTLKHPQTKSWVISKTFVNE